MTPRTLGALFLVFFGAMELFMRRGKVARSFTPRASDKGTTWVIIVCYSLVVLSLAVPLPGPVWPLWVKWCGVLSCAGGTALRLWAMHTLGQYYTRTLVTVPGQSLVEHGPYRVVRHPGYLSAILTWMGASLGAGGVAAMIVVSVLLAIAYGRRIPTEERMLVEALGAEYVAYQERSWRLVPWVY